MFEAGRLSIPDAVAHACSRDNKASHAMFASRAITRLPIRPSALYACCELLIKYDARDMAC